MIPLAGARGCDRFRVATYPIHAEYTSYAYCCFLCPQESSDTVRKCMVEELRAVKFHHLRKLYAFSAIETDKS